MQVIFGKDQAESLRDKYTILELDTFREPGLEEPITAYAVIAAGDVKLDELVFLDNHTRLHNTMLLEYRKKNWSYCHQAMEHLRGLWSGQLDSFYDIFEARINDLESGRLPDDWNGIIQK